MLVSGAQSVRAAGYLRARGISPVRAIEIDAASMCRLSRPTGTSVSFPKLAPGVAPSGADFCGS